MDRTPSNTIPNRRISSKLQWPNIYIEIKTQRECQLDSTWCKESYWGRSNKEDMATDTTKTRQCTQGKRSGASKIYPRLKRVTFLGVKLQETSSWIRSCTVRSPRFPAPRLIPPEQGSSGQTQCRSLGTDQ